MSSCFGWPHLCFIPSERLNVRLHPFQCHLLVPQAQIAGHRRVAHGEEAQRAQTIVHGDQDLEGVFKLSIMNDNSTDVTYHVLVHDEPRAVDEGGPGAEEEPAAVEPDHHGKEAAGLRWNTLKKKELFGPNTITFLLIGLRLSLPKTVRTYVCK